MPISLDQVCYRQEFTASSHPSVSLSIWISRRIPLDSPWTHIGINIFDPFICSFDILNWMLNSLQFSGENHTDLCPVYKTYMHLYIEIHLLFCWDISFDFTESLDAFFYISFLSLSDSCWRKEMLIISSFLYVYDFVMFSFIMLNATTPINPVELFCYHIEKLSYTVSLCKPKKEKKT